MDEIKLRDGRVAKVSYLSKDDSTEELLEFINGLIEENACVLYDRKFTLKEEQEWKKNTLRQLREREGYLLVARVDGKFAGDTGCKRGMFKESGNVCLGVAIAREFRGLGLGEGLLRMNIEHAKKFFNETPKNIYLSVFATNRPAKALYRKLGFKEIAVLPKWLKHKGQYIDHIYMKL